MARYREKYRLEIANVIGLVRASHYTAVWLQSGSETWGPFRVRTRMAVGVHLFARSI
jgi:hypothetical protein